MNDLSSSGKGVQTLSPREMQHKHTDGTRAQNIFSNIQKDILMNWIESEQAVQEIWDALYLIHHMNTMLRESEKTPSYYKGTVGRTGGLTWILKWLLGKAGLCFEPKNYGASCRTTHKMIQTECLYRVFIKYCGFFSKNSRKFATSPLTAPGCYWLYKKLPANRSDCTLALRWELWRSLTAM